MNLKNNLMNTGNSFLLFFEPKLDEKLIQLQNKAYYTLLSEAAKQDMKESVFEKINLITESYFQSILAEILKDDNPFAVYDFKFITKAEREKLSPIITQKLISGEISPPSRLMESVEKVMDNAVLFYDSMLSNLYEHRKEICDLLFDGSMYTAVSSVTGSGDTHNHGKYTAIINTDRGKLVYKPRSCKIDVEAYHFMKRYFDDIIVMPKAFAYEQEFGVVEFLEKKISEGDKAAARYYYALGGTTAVIKMLGSRDMHMENLFACDGRLALIDIETLLYPDVKLEKNVWLCANEESDIAEISGSVYFSALFNQRIKLNRKEFDFSIMTNITEQGSVPLVDGKPKTVLDYRKDFLDGFSDIYDRCMEKRYDILNDLDKGFSDNIVRAIILATNSYGGIIKRLNSCYSYNSEEHYAAQIEKLPVLLKRYKQKNYPLLVEKEVQALMENEVPFFYTYEDSKDIYNYGELVAKDFFDQSAIERARILIKSLSEEEKLFEISLMELILDTTPVKDEAKYPELRRDASCITAESAVIEAEKIMEYIYSKALRLISGNMLFMDYDPGRENSELMQLGLYSGISGMAVFFGAMYSCSKNPKIKAEAKECLDSCLNMLSRFLFSKETPAILKDHHSFSLGEGGGFAGILRSIVLINHSCDGICSELIDKAKELLPEIEIEDNDLTDKSLGLAGIIVTLCRYNEYRNDPQVKKTVYAMAKKLVSLKKLSSGDVTVWKTLTDKNHPISGAVHGMTGIAEALLMAGDLLKTDEFEEAARDALKFEDESYCDDCKNWLDRRIPGIKKAAKGNCYGTEGIGIVCTHLKNRGIMRSEMPRMLERADTAVRRDAPLMADHLCCGNMSTVDYFLETGDREAAGKLLNDVVKRKDENGCYKLGLSGEKSNNNVTLFFGLAGIGYELIRFTDPEAYETVL